MITNLTDLTSQEIIAELKNINGNSLQFATAFSKAIHEIFVNGNEVVHPNELYNLDPSLFLIELKGSFRHELERGNYARFIEELKEYSGERWYIMFMFTRVDSGPVNNKKAIEYLESLSDEEFIKLITEIGLFPKRYDYMAYAYIEKRCQTLYCFDVLKDLVLNYVNTRDTRHSNFAVIWKHVCLNDTASISENIAIFDKVNSEGFNYYHAAIEYAEAVADKYPSEYIAMELNKVLSGQYKIERTFWLFNALCKCQGFPRQAHIFSNIYNKLCMHEEYAPDKILRIAQNSLNFFRQLKAIRESHGAFIYSAADILEGLDLYKDHYRHKLSDKEFLDLRTNYEIFAIKPFQ